GMDQSLPSENLPVPTDAPRHRAARGIDYAQVLAARELFWHNVMREILTSLSMVSASGSAPPATSPASASAPEPPAHRARAGGTDQRRRQLFNGRLAVLTKGGERIPIAEVFPLLACGIPTADTERELSIAVECTVFQVRTPGGEVYTLPLHEIRGFHALT